jgi:hypothetical protein
MKNYIPDRRGEGNKGSSSSEPPADDGAAAVEGQLLPKLGKLKDVTRQVCLRVSASVSVRVRVRVRVRVY